jgi:hypothetical protein
VAEITAIDKAKMIVQNGKFLSKIELIVEAGTLNELDKAQENWKLIRMTLNTEHDIRHRNNVLF